MHMTHYPLYTCSHAHDAVSSVMKKGGIFMLAPLFAFGACCSAVQPHITVTCAGEERSVLYKALLGIRRQRPASGRGSIQLLTCARVTALCLSLITGLLLVLATTRTCWLTMAAYSFPATPQSGSLWACRMPAQPFTKMLIDSYLKDGWNQMQSICPPMVGYSNLPAVHLNPKP